MIATQMAPHGKIYVTHAKWFRDRMLRGSGLQVNREFNAKDFDVTRWGWKTKNNVWPTLELKRTHSAAVTA